MNAAPPGKRRARTLAMVASVVLALYAVAGFVLVPWFVDRRLPALVAERTGHALDVGETRFNPFLLRLEARDVRFADKDEVVRLKAGQFVADLSWSGLVRRAWVVEAIGLADADAEATIRPVDPAAAPAEAKPPGDDPAAQDESIPAVRLEALLLQNARFTLVDERGAAPARLELGPITLEASGLATVGDPPGQFDLRVEIPDGGTVAASGEVAASAASGTGRIAVDGLRLATLWPFVAEQVALAPPKGEFALSGNYRWSRVPGAPTLILDGIDARLAGLVLAGSDAQKTPLLALDTIAASGGQLDLDARRFQLSSLSLASGTLRADVDATGRLDWATIARADEPPEPPGAPWQVGIGKIAVDKLAVRYADRRTDRAQVATVDAFSAAAKLDLMTGERTTVEVSEAAATVAGLALTRPDSEGAARIGAVTLAGGHFSTETQRLTAERITARGGRFDLLRGPDGAVAIAGVATGEATAEPPPASGTPAGEPLRYAIGAVEIADFAAALADRSFEPPLAYGATLDAKVTNIDASAGAPIGFEAQVGLDGQGRLTAKGTLAQDASRAETEVELADLSLLPLQPVVDRYAALKLASGALGGKATVRYAASEKPRLRARGELALTGFKMNEAESGERFLSASAVNARGVLTLGPDLLRLWLVDLREPGAKLVISDKREFNLVQVLKKQPPDTRTPPPGTAGAPAEPFEARIERIRVRDGVVDFADYSLVLPFSTRVEGFTGTVVGIDTRSDAPAVLEAEGNIQPYGSARVAGNLRPRAPMESTDIRVSFDNVPMPPLSPYTATFAGRAIADGKLWLDLQYKIVNGRLEGKNDVRLEDFRLGERVEAPSAMDLPLDLAVALLKDDRGRIDLAVPVEGDVNDPEFDYGSVIRAAIGRTLKRIVTAPFRMLAGLVGAGRAEGLEEVAFAPGTVGLSPAEQEDLLAVATALGKRPELSLTVGGPYDPQRDGLALRTEDAGRALAQRLRRRLEPGESPGPFDFSDRRTQRAVVALAEDMPAPEDSAQTADAAPPATADDTARHRAIFERVAQQWPLPEERLRLLAAERAQTIVRFLVDKGGVAPERIAVGPIQTVQDQDEAVEARLEVAVRERSR